MTIVHQHFRWWRKRGPEVGSRGRRCRRKKSRGNVVGSLHQRFEEDGSFVYYVAVVDEAFAANCGADARRLQLFMKRFDDLFQLLVRRAFVDKADSATAAARASQFCMETTC